MKVRSVFLISRMFFESEKATRLWKTSILKTILVEPASFSLSTMKEGNNVPKLAVCKYPWKRSVGGETRVPLGYKLQYFRNGPHGAFWVLFH